MACVLPLRCFNTLKFLPQSLDKICAILNLMPTEEIGNTPSPNADPPLPESIPAVEIGSDQDLPVKTSKGSKKTLFLLIAVILIGLSLLGIYVYRTFFPKMPIYPNPVPPPSSSEQETPMSTGSMVNIGVQKATQAHNALGFNLLKQLAGDDEKNVVISPLSISLAFSMVYNGAGGETEMEMAEVLQVDNLDRDQLNQENLALTQDLESADPKVELSIANSIWVRKGIDFNQSFLDLNRIYYRAKVSTLDFSLPTAAPTINAWVNQNTKGKIDSIVTPPIDPMLVMYLINAVYFKGSWTMEFDPELTMEGDFGLTNGSAVPVDYMNQNRDDFHYFENDNFQAINLPYGEDEKLSMVVFLPKGGLTDLSPQLDLNNWKEWLESFEVKEGDLTLPKFKIEYETALIEPLKRLGMKKAFDHSLADFAGIADWLFISEVKHKTFIEVNEEGTEAAAVTSIGMMDSGAIIPKNETFRMIVNRPFFFAIVDSVSQQVLFTGLIYNPVE